MGNGLHWTLDVTFYENACRVRTGHAPQNLEDVFKGGRYHKKAHKAYAENYRKQHPVSK
ncbi:Transposase, IS4 [Richelia intracellularis]|nr:Transposase, IS4 [Richelia intracellularis]